MIAPLVAVVTATATAAMTLRSDTKPVTVYVKSPKGTLYWGGAGLDGVYIQPTLEALRNAGIKNVSVGLTNTATKILPERLIRAGTLIDAVRAGLTIRYEDNSEWTISSGMSGGEQFNLIGYSYGSLLAAQTANFYAKNGIIVNNLVLIASPIDGNFLQSLRCIKNIKKVTILNIKGDDIYAGISQIDLMKPLVIKKLGEDMGAYSGQGHFYFAHPVPDLPIRLKHLAEQIASTGVR